MNLPVAQEVTSDASNLVVAEGWQEVQATCTECHSSLLITQNSGDKAVWESRIRWMQETQGLQTLNPELEESILNYLAANYGQKTFSRRAPLRTQFMPENPYQPED
ncbi:MAG: hypothetical protein CMQ31_05640 [Gammaproteobacteria bacterium]|nr:hypothetical protein [Gammaproteobacteria bacterium]